MDSDDITSITDTEEAEQVVDIIEDTYNFLIIQLDPPSISQTCQLESPADMSSPTSLVIPDNVIDIGKLKYEITEDGDADRKFRDLEYYSPQDFIDKVLTRKSGDANVEQVLSPAGTPIFLFNDRSPTFWTSFDDQLIIADSYDINTEDYLSGDSTVLMCKKIPLFDKTFGGYVPDLPEKAFPLLLAESKRACHNYLKQQDSAVDAKRILQGTHTFRQKNWKAHDSKKKVNFGRK